MITHSAKCPACGTVQRFTPEEVAVYAENLGELKASPYSSHEQPGADDHQLYGYVLSHCPKCRADVIVHFNIVLHRYLALVSQALPEQFGRDGEISALELFERLGGTLESIAIEPEVDLIEL
jgi:phage FluMu protein Com